MRYKYFYVILSCSIYLCSAFKKSSTSANTKHVYFQIDEFIKQLMTSEKFEELADIIAEKAAEKIRKSEGNNSGILLSKALRDGLPKIPSQEPIKNINTDNQRETDRFKKLKFSKPQFGKIDTQALLKNHFTSKELELNFKHLTDELEKHKINEKHTQNEKPYQSEEYGKPNGKNRFRIKNDNNAEKENPYPNKEDREPYENNNKYYGDDYNIKHDSINKNLNIYESKENFNDNFRLSDEKFSSKEQENFDDRSIDGEKLFMHENKSKTWSPEANSDLTKESAKINDKSRFYKIYDSREFRNLNGKGGLKSHAEISKGSANKSDKEQNYNPISSSKEVLEVGINRALSGENAVNNPSKTKYISGENIKNKIIEDNTKGQIRIENGKMYAYNSSPDYAEYHENRDKNIKLATP